MFHNCEGQSQDCPQTTTFKKRKAEADSNRIPSAYLPNALPLGQTGEFARAFKKLKGGDEDWSHGDGSTVQWLGEGFVPVHGAGWLS